MDSSLLILIAVGLFSGLLAWAIGANDVANSFGTSVGSRALTVPAAIVLAALFEFAGSVLMGAHVAATFKGGIIDMDAYADDPDELLLGMCATSIGAFVMVLAATAFSLPVSGTHAAIGAMIGFSVAAKGSSTVEWWGVLKLVAGWVLSPVLAGAVGFTLFLFTRAAVLRSHACFRRTLVLFGPTVGFVVAVNMLVTLYEGAPAGIDLRDVPEWIIVVGCWASGLLIGGSVALCTPWIEQRLIGLESADDEEERTETSKLDASEQGGAPSGMPSGGRGTGGTEMGSNGRSDFEVFDEKSEHVFGYMQVLMAVFLSFAHGANDIANAIGPLAIAYEVYRYDEVDEDAPVRWWMLVGPSVLVVAGLAMWGYRVMRTIGEKIAKLTKTRGFHVEFGASMTVILGTRFGLPLSTTHCKVGSVVGVGLADGKGAVNVRTVVEIAAGWMVTLPVSGAVSALCYLLLKWM